MGSLKPISVVNWPHRFFAAAAKSIAGIVAAISARPTVFAAVSLSVFILNVLLPRSFFPSPASPGIISRSILGFRNCRSTSAQAMSPFKASLSFFPSRPVLVQRQRSNWVCGMGIHCGRQRPVEVRLHLLHRRVRILRSGFIIGIRWLQCGWTGENSRRFGIAGALMSILGLSTGPCSVMGCGAPVLPVIGLAFVGLSSGTPQVACRPVKGFHRCYSVRHDFRRRLFWLDRERSFRNCLPPVADLLRAEKPRSLEADDEKTSRKILRSPLRQHPNNKQDAGFTLSKNRRAISESSFTSQLSRLYDHDIDSLLVRRKSREPYRWHRRWPRSDKFRKFLGHN